jgi:hypothetical protein
LSFARTAAPVLDGLVVCLEGGRLVDGPESLRVREDGALAPPAAQPRAEGALEPVQKVVTDQASVDGQYPSIVAHLEEDGPRSATIEVMPG